MKIGLSLRSEMDSRESIRANCTDSRCESPGHLSKGKNLALGVMFLGSRAQSRVPLHKMISEPNFTIFEIFSVIPAL